MKQNLIKKKPKTKKTQQTTKTLTLEKSIVPINCLPTSNF